MSKRCYRYGCYYHPSRMMFESCDYCITEGHSRGCPVGAECDKYKPRAGANRRPRPITASSAKPERTLLPAADILRLYKQGMRSAAIARELNLRPDSVVSWLRRHNCPSHGRGRPKKEELKCT